MRFFLSLLTVYTYPDEIRIRLNKEEAEKFWEGFKYARDFSKGFVFSDYSVEEMKNILSSLTKEEREIYQRILYLHNQSPRNIEFVKVDLTDYKKSYNFMRRFFEDKIGGIIKKSENVGFTLNISCGHKVGALALYISLMEVAHSKQFYKYMGMRGKPELIIDVYHAERGIEKFPIMHFKSEEKTGLEEYLKYIENTPTLEEFRKNTGDERGKVIMYLKKHGYVVLEGNKLYLTKRGETMIKLLERLKLH